MTHPIYLSVIKCEIAKYIYIVPHRCIKMPVFHRIAHLYFRGQNNNPSVSLALLHSPFSDIRVPTGCSLSHNEVKPLRNLIPLPTD